MGIFSFGQGRKGQENWVLQKYFRVLFPEFDDLKTMVGVADSEVRSNILTAG
jgi:hypothetical protein